MVWQTYKERVKKLSQRIVEAQRPIRVLEAIKWQPRVEAQLRKSKYREVPVVTAEDYARDNPLGYDARAKLAELAEIREAIKHDLGELDPLGRLLITTTAQYEDVIHMLLARGTKQFWEYSRKLYGSPKDHLHDDTNTISDLGRKMYEILGNFDERAIGLDYPENLTAEQVVSTLNERFSSYFPEGAVSARLSDGILADASAGGDVVKIKEGAMFSSRDVDILEVHEGWVHVGTTQNGNAQHVAKWLAKGPPRCASTQEGLAVIMEIFTFRTYPRRARQINDRILGIEKAEDGADIVELIEFYRTEGYSEDESIANAKRVCRGGVLTGGAPFTKDISYCRGFIENYNFMRSAVKAGYPQILPFLFAGKLHTDDVPLLFQKYKEGLIDFPRFLPPQFRDLSGIAVWMSFSSFLNMVDLKKTQEHYGRLFAAHL